MYRKSQVYLKKWIEKKLRKPLVLRGARQVGKSTLVRLFAESEKLDLCEINLEKHPELNSVFQTLQVPRILTEIQAITGKKIHEKSLLFLDEIQAVPIALASLRYFFEDRPQLPVIAAGSLLDFILEETQYSVPVGRVEYHYLGPLDFDEFLQAMGELELLAVVNQFTLQEDLAEFHHRKLMERLKEFYFVGGMPEAVLRYSTGDTPDEAQDTHRALIATYREDFNKYAKRQDVLLLQEVFNKISLTIGRKVKYTELARDEKSRDIKRVLQLIFMARLAQPIFHSDCSGIPLKAMVSPDVYKILYLDLGLLNFFLGLKWKDFSSLKNDELLTIGLNAEQFVGQTLLYGQPNPEPELYYWQRNEKSSLAEVDYVIQIGQHIIPIEVKAGTSGKLKSLHQFIASHHTRVGLKIDANPPSQKQVKHSVKTSQGSQEISFNLVSLPLYLTTQIERVVRAAGPEILTR